MNKLVEASVVAEYLSVSPKTILSWAETGKLPHYKLGNGQKSPVRFDLSEVLNWLKGCKKDPLPDYNTTAETLTVMAREGRV